MLLTSIISCWSPRACCVRVASSKILCLTTVKTLIFKGGKEMKKTLFIAAIAVAALSSCQVKESIESPANGRKMIEVPAVFGDGELLSKTTLELDSPSFHWSEDDKIVAWNGTEATEDCAISLLDDDGNASFLIPEETKWVIYPSRRITYNEKDGSIVWRRSSNLYLSEEGSELIGAGSNPMFGRLVNGKLVFTNMCGCLRFQLTGTKAVRKFGFKSNNIDSPAISGDASFNVEDDYPVLTYPVLNSVAQSGIAKYDYLTINGRDIQLSSTPESFYVVLPPGTYKSTEMVIEFVDGTSAVLLSSHELTVERNKVRTVNPIDTDALFPASTVALDVNGRSNCYMVIAGDEPVHYSFTAQKIVSETFFDEAKVASILWSESPSLIKSLTYDSNTHIVTFLYGGKGEEGNAVITLDKNLLNTSATLLWNYHIWVTDEPENILMDETDMPQAILDRNVGATWAPKSEAEIAGMTKEQWLETTGTYYQYGNHIPFPRMAEARNATDRWDNLKVGVMYGFSNYCQRFAWSTSIKETLETQEQFPNYEYQLTQKYNYLNDKGEEKEKDEQIWSQVALKGGPKGDGFNIWETNNSTTVKLSDYDPCPQGYTFITATHLYQETLKNDVTDHVIGDFNAGKYNTDASEHIMYFPAAGYLGSGKNSMVGERIVYWTYYLNNSADMGHTFRRCMLRYVSAQNDKKFFFDNQSFSSQAHNMRCRVLE